MTTRPQTVSFPLKQLSFLWIGILVLCAATHAGACDIVATLSKSGNGIHIVQNPCEQQGQLGLNSQLQLTPNARLWLKGRSLTDNNTQIQLICQNNSQQLITLVLASPLAPWFNFPAHPECSNWTNQRLACFEKNSKRPLLLCALLFSKPQTASPVVEQTTSVKMRNLSLSKTNQTTIEQTLIKIKPEIELCFRLSGQSAIPWSLTPNPAQKSIDIVFSQPLNNLPEACLSDIIPPQDWHLSIITP